TNHHVIEGGEQEDFKTRVTVLLGHISKATGAMERGEKEYEAIVYKADKLRDIALLKLVDPPKNLPSVKIAKNKPVPGSQVVALGHAGAGMLWALKSGQISALGKLSEALAQVAAFKDDEEGKKAAEAFRKFMDEQNLGLIIQSTCSILPGDSGGPLLNDHGELIGLNVFARKDAGTGGLLSFHVHLDEITAFAKDRPEHPIAMIPDPWLEGGGEMSLEDADLDGTIDVLMLQGRKPCAFCPRQSTAVFMDVDQSSFRGRAVPDDLNALFTARDFDAEAVFLQLEHHVFIWYDSDNDGRFDVLLFDDGTTGIINAGYAIAPDGALTRRDDLSGIKPFRAAIFNDNKLGERFAEVTRAAFPDRYTDAPDSIHTTLPDPVGTSGSAIASDLDEDGQRDALQASTPFSKRMLIDTDHNFVPRLQPFVEVKSLAASRPDFEVAVVSQGTHMWTFYDRDDDGRFDLALHAPGARIYAATEAWTLDASGNRTPAPEHVGRMLLRPGLLEGEHRKALTAMVKEGLLAIMSAEDDGLGSFPDPIEDHRGTRMEILDLPSAPKTTIALVGIGSDGYLLDLDRSSGLFGAIDQIDIEKRVMSGKIDAELAYFHRNGVAWAFYDTTFQPGYDLVLVSLDPKTGRVDAAFHIEQGKVRYDADLTKGKLIRPSLFDNAAMKKQLQTIAGELFTSAMVE
ncbi:MAG: trypsin-like peptidase domain-containing protein, partial [Myxococcales bacterium]|nr:trypsin-like peptidase domain-containing protein [Myxococcales bacterium]